MHLLLFSDEESEGSLPGSSDVSPRNAPSVHRIVNRYVPTERNIITGRNEVLDKVMFLQVSVILLTGGGVPDQAHPTQTRQVPPPDQAGTPLLDQAGTPPWTRQVHPPLAGTPPW